jgi:inorganic pyrophosphatase
VVWDAADSSKVNASDAAATLIIVLGAVVGMAFAVYQYLQVAAVKLAKPASDSAADRLMDDMEQDKFDELNNIYELVRKGANAFLMAEYTLCFIFIAVFGLIVLVLTAFVNTDSKDYFNARAADGDHNFAGHYDGESFDWSVGALTAVSFAVGGLTSILSGWIGMTVAVFANARCAMSAAKAKEEEAWKSSFNTAFQAGSVMGFALCGLALGMLFILINLFSTVFDMDFDVHKSGSYTSNGQTLEITTLMECIAGYGLGGSCIALFGRVGGGIYTKAADVGADLAGKVVNDLPEDDPRNPATIADNVGDNVGDVAGMGSDLFGSFAEATCAALVISTQYPSFDFLNNNGFIECACDAGQATCRTLTPFLVESGFPALMFPLLISAVSIFVCLICSFLATHVWPVRKEEDVENVLKVQLGVTCVVMTLVMIPLCSEFLPKEFVIQGVTSTVSRWDAFLCVACGLFGGCIIGFVTEYYTSASYTPVRDVAYSCETGAATNIIYGLALGYKSCIIPIVIIALNVFIAFKYAGMYGVALSALGFLGTLSTCLSIDVYGPVCDNAGGLAEMSDFPQSVRDKTDALDAAGNTTAAIGKGFAIGSAALVSLALFGGFQARVSSHLDQTPTFGMTSPTIVIDILQPITFAFFFVGAMLPYAFTAFTMKSVGVAANEMVKEVARQFREKPHLIHKGTDEKPDYDQCIKISTESSLREMILPGLLVILSPIITGILFGIEGVCGLLVGGLTSGVQLAISQSNAGGAWDNAKKYVEKGMVILATADPLGEHEQVDSVAATNSHLVNVEKLEQTTTVYYKHAKKTEVHKSAVVGDTVGDPLKDTSGPALNILMKLMAIISLVFADFFCGINNGQGLFKTSREVTHMTGN